MTMMVFHSPESIADVRNLILSELGEQPFLRLWPFVRKHKDFHGWVWDDGFRLSRIIDYRNPYLPVACGHLESEPTGTKISIRLRMNRFAIAFSLFWTAGWLLMAASNFLGAHPGREMLLGFSLMMIASHGMIVMLSSVAEEGEYRLAFRRLFEARKPSQVLASVDSRPLISN